MKQFTFLTQLIISTILISLTTYSSAQVKYTVLTSGNTFVPANITIEIGDTVEWKNMGGTHNVNATQTTFPANPESFGNALGTGWTFSHVFNTLGNYDYRCDLHFSMGMVGTVIVNNTTSINGNDVIENEITFYPNPSKDYLNWINADKFDVIELIDRSGKTVLEVSTKFKSIDLSNFPKGLYLIRAKNKNQVIIKKINLL